MTERLEPLLSVTNLSKFFGDIRAVSDVSFDISDGEFVAILGPSGSGKSTILRMIAGFENPSSGNIAVRGVDMEGVPPFERDVNMVFQHLALFPHLSVKQNIAYGLKNQGVPEEEREERIHDILEMVKLTGYDDRDPMELSGGEQQRVALARAVVNQPDIVLFDEPLASLDRKLRQHMQVELQRIQAETEITFLYVTHDQEVAMSVSDRLILLQDGKLEQMGSAEELYDEPVSQFVADFIGDTNTIRTSVENVGSSVTLNAGDYSFTYPSDVMDSSDKSDFSVGETVDMCVRPHALDLVESPSGHSYKIEGQVDSRIYQGHYITYNVQTSLGTLTVSTEDQGFTVGDEAFVVWDGNGTHFFRNAKLKKSRSK